MTGLADAKPGEGLGAERDAGSPMLEPVLTYQVLLPEGADVLPPWRSCAASRRKYPNCTWCGTRLWARSICA